jgi:hypothetical protein
MDGALAIGTKLRARMSQKSNVIAKPNSEDDNLVKKEIPSEIEHDESFLEVGSRVEALYRGRGRKVRVYIVLSCGFVCSKMKSR